MSPSHNYWGFPAYYFLLATWWQACKRQDLILEFNLLVYKLTIAHTGTIFGNTHTYQLPKDLNGHQLLT